jgi:hypothetical protein
VVAEAQQRVMAGIRVVQLMVLKGGHGLSLQHEKHRNNQVLYGILGVLLYGCAAAWFSKSGHCLRLQHGTLDTVCFKAV